METPNSTKSTPPDEAPTQQEIPGSHMGILKLCASWSASSSLLVSYDSQINPL